MLIPSNKGPMACERACCTAHRADYGNVRNELCTVCTCRNGMFLYVQYVYEQCRFSYGHALHVSKVHMCMYRVQSACVTFLCE